MMRSNAKKLKVGLEYYLLRRGPLAMCSSPAALFARTRPELASPDVKLSIQPFSADRPQDGLHKWSGFSTGHWERNTLVYTTDHLKEAYLTRTGVPKSDKATVTTRVHRYGNVLTIIFIINDPAYLTGPYIRESSWIYDPNQVIPPFPCEITPDGTIIPAGKVPSFLPGRNDILADFATEYGIPLEATLGGEETLYPEYIKKMKTMKVAPRTSTEHYRRTQ